MDAPDDDEATELGETDSVVDVLLVLLPPLRRCAGNERPVTDPSLSLETGLPLMLERHSSRNFNLFARLRPPKGAVRIGEPDLLELDVSVLRE